MTARVAVFFGTRPEAVKLAPVIHRLRGEPGLQPIVVSTGQHRDMLRQVIACFGLNVDRELEVMTPDQSLAGLTARVLEAADHVLAETLPDLVMVQGDTTSAFAVGLAAFYRQIPVAHVEAGLRTWRLYAPFPEEMNRTALARLASLHFAPTEQARRNLRAEGIPGQRIVVTGNTVVDALHFELRRQEQPKVHRSIDEDLRPVLGKDWRNRPFALVTGHRRESFDGGIERICEAIGVLARRFPEHRWIYPVHPNPRVRKAVGAKLASFTNIVLIEPLSYPAFVALMTACRLILTDSGGVQEEAPSLGKPLLIMRDATERPEIIEMGMAMLVGTDPERIVREAARLLTDEAMRERIAGAANPYGDGRAAERIVDASRAFLAEEMPEAELSGRVSSE